MSRFLAFWLILIGLLGAAAVVDWPGYSAAGDPVAMSSWRRTRDGWERMTTWHESRAAPLPTPADGLPHPAVIAAVQVAASAGWLAVFSRR